MRSLAKLKFYWKIRHKLDFRLKLLRVVGGLLYPRYRFHAAQLDWWQNPAFNDYLTRFGEIKGVDADRRWMVSQLLRLVEAVPGDTAECGVFKGSSSYLMCKANANTTHLTRWHYMFDSFEGLSEPTATDGDYWTPGDLTSGLEEARDNLAEFMHCTLYKGWIPEKFPAVQDKRFAFVHIDVDLYEPTRDSIAFFYPRLNPGGVILCDDYGSSLCPGATRAIDEFLSDKAESMISLCAGGGFMIKGCQTAPEFIV